ADAGGRPVPLFTADPFDAAQAFLAEHGCMLGPYDSSPPEPRVLGFFGYDLARIVEQLPGGPRLGQDTPDLWLAAYGAVARWDAAGRMDIVGDDAAARDDLSRALTVDLGLGLAPRIGAFAADDDGAHHVARVERIRDYLAAG